MSGSRSAPLPVQKCLGDAVEQGRLTRAQAEEALALVQRYMAENAMPPDAAAAAAAKQLAIEAARKRRQAALQVVRTREALDNARSHPSGFTAGVAALFARDITGRAGYSNVEARARAIRGIAHAQLADFLDRFRTKRLGLTRDQAGLRGFVRALYGEATPDEQAADLARAWTQTTDGLVQRFNDAGGALGRRENWRLPQPWDAARVKAAGREAFTAYMTEAAESGRLRITDWETGEPVDALKRAIIINEAFQRISTDGLSDLTPGAAGRPSVANSRNTRRAFEWTSADAYLDFTERFGMGEAALFDMMVGHIDGLARDIAMLEILGPNPAHLARVLIDTARKEGAGSYSTYKLAAIWDHVSGAAQSPVSEWLASAGRNVLAFLTSVQLGSATLSSVTDFSTMRATAAWNGLDASRMMGRYVEQLRAMASDVEANRIAVRSGLIAEGWAQRAAGAMRDQAEVVGTSFFQGAADFVLRASGMQAHTQAGRWAFGMEFLGHLADQAGRTLDQLDEPTRRAFARYGITAEHWEVIRTRGLLEEDGLRIIHPERIVTGAPDEAPIGDAAGVTAAEVAPLWQPGDPLPQDVIEAEALSAELARRPTIADQSPERHALRASIMNEMAQRRLAEIGGAPAQERDATIVIGLPAAGKSTILEPLARAKRALIIDADDMKAALPEFNGGLGAARVHDESALMAAELLDKAAATGANIALARVGANEAPMRQLIEQLKAVGYTVTLILNELPIEQAASRNIARFRETGRLVPHEYLMGIASRPADVYIALQEIVDAHARYSREVPRGALPVYRGGSADLIRNLGLEQSAGRSGSARDGAGAASAAAPLAGREATDGLRPGAAADLRLHREAASRLLEMVQTEAHFAVVEPGALERALLLGRSRPGTLGGEFLRSAMQFKSFPVAMMTRHAMRGLGAYRAGDRGRYMVATAVSLTLMGALAMQLKAIAQGRDPRDMSDPAFWGAAFIQGGGAGIVGDFLFAGVSRSDRSFYMTLVGGPTAGLVDDLARLTGGNIQGLAEARDTHFGAELARFVQRNTPGGTLWYARLALDRLMFERLHELADDDRARRIARMERRALDEFGQRFWWRPGQASPERAPSLGASIGGQPE